MLKPAWAYKDKLQAEYSKIVFSEAYRFYNNANYWKHEVELSKDSWVHIEYVSVDNTDNVVGYMGADISRPENYVDGLSALNFKSKGNVVFSKDFYEFLDSLFTKSDFYKMTFYVVVGNPIEKMYDKFTSKYGGRIVGHYKKHVMLDDGKLYDRKHYEIFKEDYLKAKAAQ
jgi:hypothetical protein